MRLALSFLLLVPSIASAQPFQGEQPDTWETPASREQAERDPTLVPVGKGAVFVPCMTECLREPQYLVLQGSKIVATVPAGRRAVLDPGTYDMRIGSGSLSERLSRHVLVKEGRTTIVPATWSTLLVNVVDDRSEPFRGAYELIRVPGGTNLGLGLGADVELGEQVRAWVLEPGTYMIIKSGGSLQARRDFYTFRLRPGEMLKLALVVDRNDGSLLGAGQVALAGWETAISDWRLHFVIGADAEMNKRSNITGLPSGYGFTLGGYLDFVAQYRPDKHFVYTRLRVQEKQLKIPGQVFQKDQDELKADALYVYRVLPWLGPYVRFGASTSAFPGYAYFSSPTEVVEVDKKGYEVGSFGTYSKRFQIAKPFAPVQLKSGLGLGFIITASYVLDANVRVGFGGRILLNRGLLDPQGTSSTGQYEVLRRGDAYQYGLESTVVASLRASRWVLATTEFDMLESINDPRHPVIDWENNVALRLVSFVSLNYIYRLISDVSLSTRLQQEHRLLLRFTWQIL